MPQSVQYIIRRSVAAGYTLDAVDSFDLQVKVKDRGRKAIRDRAISLGGTVFTTYHRAEVSWSVHTTWFKGADADRMRMFLDSVEDGQIFQFDPTHGAGASPHDRRNVVIDSISYSENREQTGTQTNDWFAFSFKLVEVG